MLSAIILAAGSSSRMGGVNKQFLELDGVPVLVRSIQAFLWEGEADEILVVCRRSDWEAVSNLAGRLPKVRVVPAGGETRQQSVENALSCLYPLCDMVAIHDGARPFVPQEMLRRILDATAPGIGVVPGTPVTDTIKRVDAEGFIVETPPRETLRAAQTPQCFMAAEIRALHLEMAESGRIFTDDAMLYEAGGKRVRMVDGSSLSRKLTVPEDLFWATEMKHAWEAEKR